LEEGKYLMKKMDHIINILTKIKKILIRLFEILLIAGVSIAVYLITINVIFLLSSGKYIDSSENLSDQKFDCILVLGAGVWGNSRPSPMLEDRLITAIDLYNEGVSAKILMSGDNGEEYYDEVNVMKNYAIERGVPSEDIFMDHAGFSTYESIYRAKYIFQAESILIVTQKYHLHRAVYIAKRFGLNVYGVSADRNEYLGQRYRDLREFLARNKDFILSIYKPEPTFLGDVIPIDGDGDVTNDK